MKKILYIANMGKDANLAMSKEIISFILDSGCEVYVNNDLLLSIKNTQLATHENLQTIDLMIVLGGDGTILINAQKYHQYSIPIMGINQGRVGALAVCELNDYKHNFQKYLNNDYVIGHHLALDGKIIYAEGGSDSFTTFNDIFVHRGMSTKLLKTIISVNDNEFSDVYADGVIVSTPIGSSAYNLSAGGPLLATGSNCYVITPICPQSRTVTSIVLSKDDVTSLTIGENVNTERSDNVVVVDGYVKYPVNANDVVLIEKSNKSLQLVQFSKHKFLYESVYKTVVSINKKSSN